MWIRNNLASTFSKNTPCMLMSKKPEHRLINVQAEESISNTFSIMIINMPVDKINPIAYDEMEFHNKTFVSEIWKLTIITIHKHVFTHHFQYMQYLYSNSDLILAF